MSIHTLTFEELAKSMERDLYLTCYGMLCHREDTADALQETMLRAWKGFHGFRGEAQWKTWFHRIAVNVCMSFMATSSHTQTIASGSSRNSPSSFRKPFLPVVIS